MPRKIGSPRRPTVRFTAGERAFLKAVWERPAAHPDDTVMLQDDRLVLAEHA